MTYDSSPTPIKDLEVNPLFELAQRTSTALNTGIDPFTRTIYLVGEINEDSLCHFLPAFNVLDSTDGTIRVVLSSPGGSEPAGWAIHDLIKLALNPVVVDGYGLVASIAAIILQAGSYRRLAPSCRFMIHNGSVLIDGGIGANEAVGMGEEVKKNNEKYAKTLQERSKLTLKEVEGLCRAETFMSADEAIKAGFADGTIPNQKPKTRKLVRPGGKKNGKSK